MDAGISTQPHKSCSFYRAASPLPFKAHTAHLSLWYRLFSTLRTTLVDYKLALIAIRSIHLTWTNVYLLFIGFMWDGDKTLRAKNLLCELSKGTSCVLIHVITFIKQSTPLIGCAPLGS